MFFIPGFIINILTFPGVIVRGFVKHLLCKWCGIVVFDVCYFRIGNPSGYVVHEVPGKKRQQLLLSTCPFLVNTVLGALIAMPAAIPVFRFGAGNMFDYFLIYLGVSVAMHSFPSPDDAKALWRSMSRSKGRAVQKLVAVPVSGFIYLGALGSFFWLDLLYGIAVVIGIPGLLINVLA